MQAETQHDIKAAFRNVGVQRIEFGNWDGAPDQDGGETSSVTIHTSNGSLEIEATHYGTLQFTEH